jgi:hypothetical protein
MPRESVSRPDLAERDGRPIRRSGAVDRHGTRSEHGALQPHPGDRFLLDQVLADTNSGHNIAQTVFIECGSMYRADGPIEMKPRQGPRR